jgi:hypothetical protein
MMAITAAALNAALGTTGRNAQVVKDDGTYDTVQRWYVLGGVDAPGRARWVETTAADDAATQATAVLVALRA